MNGKIPERAREINFLAEISAQRQLINELIKEFEIDEEKISDFLRWHFSSRARSFLEKTNDLDSEVGACVADHYLFDSDINIPPILFPGKN